MYDGTSAVAGVRKARQDRHGSGMVAVQQQQPLL